MSKKLFDFFLKENVPVNLIQGDDIRVIVQDDDTQNEAWESDIKAIKLLIDMIPIDFIEKHTEEPLIREKIILLLLNCIGEFLKDYYIVDFSREQDNIETIHYFLEVVNKEMAQYNTEFKKFIQRYA
jgi:hypothetical protein